LLAKLVDPDTAAAYLNEAMNDSPEIFLKALRNVAQARRVANVAKKAGVRRESLYRTLSKNGNPRLGTLNSVLQAVGLRIAIQAGSSAKVHLSK
jgi:probable addiction module antidote protein